MIHKTSSSELTPSELRTAYREAIQEEINSRDPHEGAKLLYKTDPEQLELNFVFHKTCS